MRAVEKLLTIKRLLAHLSRDYAPVAMYQTFCAEDIVLAHLIFSDLVHTEYKNIHMFAIDTGRTTEDVYRAMESLQKRYGNVLTVYHPDARELANFDARHGFGSDYYRLSSEIRFNRPLNQALIGKNAWISTGFHRYNESEHQNNSVNRDKAWITWDSKHQLPCFNPMVRWTQEEILNYAKHHGLTLLNEQEQIRPSINSVANRKEQENLPAAVGLR
jgi:phosphoadenosine phosphosulfate reductase